MARLFLVGESRAATVVVALAAAVILGVGATFGRGLDFWDESYTLLLADRPSASDRGGEIFLFQFLLHPLLEVLGRDVALLRWFGLAVLCGAAGAMTLVVARTCRGDGLQVSQGEVRVAAVVVAACATIAYVGAGRAPGNRIVTMIGLMVAVIGVSWVLSGLERRGAVVVGGAVVLTLAGKPTSALALAILVGGAFVALSDHRQLARRLFWAVMGALAGLIVIVTASGMPPVDLAGYVHRGVAVEQASGAHADVAGMIGLSPVPLRVFLAFGPFVLWPLLLAERARVTKKRWPLTAQIGVGVLLPLMAASLALSVLAPQGFGGQIRLLAWWWPIVAVAVCFTALRSAGVRRTHRVSLLLFCLLLVLPYVATLGTNTNFSLSMMQAAGFWSLAVFVALGLVAGLRPSTASLRVPLAIFLVTTTAVGHVVWFGDVLEGRGVRLAAVSTQVLGGRLQLEPDAAAVMNQLAELSREYDLAGRPLIDLTGMSSGYQLAMGTRPLGRASFFGTFPGAAKGAAVALARESCADRAGALILYSSDNPLDVSDAVRSWPIDLARDYVELARFTPAHGEKVIRDQSVRVLAPQSWVGDRLGCPGVSVAVTP